MRKRLLYAIPVAAVAIAAAVWLLWPQQKVTVTTGKIVMCTQGEMISDDTRELQVLANKVGEYGVKTEVTTCERHRRLADLRAKAATAIQAGDLAAAAAALQEVVRLDPSDTGASQQLASVKAGRKPASTPASNGGSKNSGGTPSNEDDPPTTDPGEGETPSGPNASLTDYVPDTLKGFVGQGIIADPFVLWRDYLPSQQGNVLQLVVMAEQHGSESQAQQIVDTEVKSYYSATPAQVSVGGHKAYFGTRNKLAVLALADGSIRVVVEGTVVSGDPAVLKSALVSAMDEILK